MPFHLEQCLDRLATRNPGRTEADIQADVRDVLLYGGFELGDENVYLESPAPDRRRIDVEVGALVIECKRDLRPARIQDEAESQLAGYLSDRLSSSGCSYVGILTDGVSWRCYRHADSGVEFVSALELRAGVIDERKFRWWLGSLLATERLISPTGRTIEERLGSESPGCQIVIKELVDLLSAGRESPEVQLKRALWAKLLRTALGTQFEDDDSLFIEHTYLVIVATLIAHIVIGFDPVELGQAPATILSGQLFARSGIRGVGEAGFFDWVLDVPGGERTVSDLARRLSVFAWAGVDHDVLKALYQSVIEPETRHRLGEYYTPDWLARRMIDEVDPSPLESRILDPACGSGTFLFHAVRRYLIAAESADISPDSSVAGVTDHVFGMDLHPVAVVLAQVTYLLAIGSDRITRAGLSLSIPVYLGDSMRWEASEESFLSSSGEIVISTGVGPTLFATEELRFPASVVSDPARFDQLVDDLATRAANRPRGERPLPISGVLSSLAVSDADRPVIEATYKHLCDLHDQGRNHIWGFFIRNQSRPSWFASRDNRVDILVGNPPWLSYRFMPEEMKSRFRQLAEERHLWAGGRVATHQDLSAFFVARSIEQYLRVDGKFAFVMPLAALSRFAYAGFRAGDFSTVSEQCVVSFEIPWNLDAVEPDIFPVPSCVVVGRKIAPVSHTDAVPLPAARLIASGHLDMTAGADAASDISWVVKEPDDSVTAYTEAGSPYSSRFRQGATLVPRSLVLVEELSPGPLQPKTRSSVRSRRGRLDRRPWNALPDQTGLVERIFVRNVLLGEHCLPFRTLPPVTAVIPFDGKDLLSGSDGRIDRYPGLAEWWRSVERVWMANRSSERLTLLERVNYHGELSSQFPVPPIRVVYTKAGNYLTASIVTDQLVVIDHKLYWGATATMEEAYFLTAILNAPALGKIVAPYQSRGAFGTRDFDKYVWYPPIPEYDGSVKEHQRLSQLGAQASELVAEVEIPSGVGFQRARGMLRGVLTKSGVLDDMDVEVQSILTVSGA